MKNILIYLYEINFQLYEFNISKTNENDFKIK